MAPPASRERGGRALCLPPPTPDAFEWVNWGVHVTVDAAHFAGQLKGEFRVDVCPLCEVCVTIPCPRRGRRLPSCL